MGASAARLTALAELAAVVAGNGLHLAAVDATAHHLWAGTTAMLLVPISISVVRTLSRRDLVVDAIALVSMAGGTRVTAPVERAPRVALVRRGDELEELPIDAVQTGDVVFVRGEVVPVDGMVESEEAVLDESALTGEPLPVTVPRGGPGPQRHGKRRRRLRGALVMSRR